MLRTLLSMQKADRYRYRIPRSVQQTIPIERVYDDGMFRVGRDKYSKSYIFTDINYQVASVEEKEEIFRKYSSLINSYSAMTTKITILNRRLNEEDFEKNMLFPLKQDSLDVFREEYNALLRQKILATNSIVQDKFITVSTFQKSEEDARKYFLRITSEMTAQFSRFGSLLRECTLEERLRVFHDFFSEQEEEFHFQIRDERKRGQDFRDSISPVSMKMEKDCIKFGDRYLRALFLQDVSSYMKDDILSEFTSLNENMALSIDTLIIPTDEAMRDLQNRLLGVQTNMASWQRRQNENSNYQAVLPYNVQLQVNDLEEFIEDITTRDQKMTLNVFTLVHSAETKEKLDSDTQRLLSIARSRRMKLRILNYQQLDGLNTALPYGVRRIDAFRTLTTEALAAFSPFRVQDIHHKNGIYYGQNVINNNMIMVDRKELLNGNSFILGVSGGGKSFISKDEIVNLILNSDSDVIIIDPEREYTHLTKALGGEVINISSTSSHHLNPLDINREYADGANPVILKSEFILSLCEQLMEGKKLGAVQKSIIDRCTAGVYFAYQQRDYQGEVPTLEDFRKELLKQNEEAAKEIALAIELYTQGSLNTFAKPTNVDTKNRLLCYDILDLGEHLMPIGMLTVLDSILNRITKNRRTGKSTFIFIDEIYLLFKYEYSANFLFTLWKRVRKYGAYATGITQNVSDLLRSYTAKTMLSNSEFIIMLNQAADDRNTLAELLNISSEQLVYLTDVEAGNGLIKIGRSLVPFVNRFPKDTMLYRLMSTKPGEFQTEQL